MLAKSVLKFLSVSLALGWFAACAQIDRSDQHCVSAQYSDKAYTVCTAHPANDQIQLFYADAQGAPFLTFDRLRDYYAEADLELVFAMNGGMYHEDRAPVGLYIDPRGRRARLNLREGPGNFHLLPNGVFVLDSGAAYVLESNQFAELYEEDDPDYATQSGPMLVINNRIHPGLNPEGTSRRRRNGVGVSADGSAVFFVISEGPVTFHEFASVFKDDLGAPNALFLDGTVSKLYSVELGRNDQGLDMGPIVGLIR